MLVWLTLRAVSFREMSLTQQAYQGSDDDQEGVRDGQRENNVFGDAELVQERLLATSAVCDVEFTCWETQKVSYLWLYTWKYNLEV